MHKQINITHLLELLLGDRVNALGDLIYLVGLVALDKTGTGKLNTSINVLAELELLELGGGLGLGEVLLADARSDLLEGVDDLLGGTLDILGGTLDRNGEETSVGVDSALGLNVGTLELGGSLGEERETGRPLDGGLTTEESGENGNLGLVVVTSGGA